MLGGLRLGLGRGVHQHLADVRACTRQRMSAASCVARLPAGSCHMAVLGCLRLGLGRGGTSTLPMCVPALSTTLELCCLGCDEGAARLPWHTGCMQQLADSQLCVQMIGLHSFVF